MKVHKSITKQSLHLVLNALTECGEENAPVIVSPGTYHGRPAVVIAVHDGSALLPLAVVLDPESDDAAYLTIEGTTLRGPVAPSPVGEVPEDAALAVLRDVAAATPTQFATLRERAQRVLAGRPIAPAAPVAHTGLYL